METILTQEAETTKLNISVRPFHENGLEMADHIMRLAFGTFIDLPEPKTFEMQTWYKHGGKQIQNMPTIDFPATPMM